MHECLSSKKSAYTNLQYLFLLKTFTNSEKVNETNKNLLQHLQYVLHKFQNNQYNDLSEFTILLYTYYLIMRKQLNQMNKEHNIFDITLENKYRELINVPPEKTPFIEAVHTRYKSMPKSRLTPHKQLFYYENLISLNPKQDWILRDAQLILRENLSHLTLNQQIQVIMNVTKKNICFSSIYD